MTRDSLKESVRKIVDEQNVFWVESVCKWWARNNHVPKVDRRYKLMD